MFLRIESASGVPITRQLADQIRAHCARGVLSPGDRLPSVRQLARDLAVNQNTVLHVYERLTHEGLLQRRQGYGTFVADTLPDGHATAPRISLASDLDRVAGRMLSLGIEDAAAHEMLDESLARARESQITQFTADTPRGQP